MDTFFFDFNLMCDISYKNFKKLCAKCRIFGSFIFVPFENCIKCIKMAWGNQHGLITNVYVYVDNFASRWDECSNHSLE